MQLYQPTITGSLSVSGSINLSGSITIAGGGTISGTASIATNAITASSECKIRYNSSSINSCNPRTTVHNLLSSINDKHIKNLLRNNIIT